MDSINFLDLTIHKDKSIFKTKKTKTEDRNTILHVNRFQPKLLKENVPHGQLSGCRKSVARRRTFVQIRGDAVMQNKPQKAYTKTKSLDRQTQLERNVPKQTKDRLVFVTTFVTEAENIKGHLTKTGTLLKVSDNSGKFFPQPSLISFRRCPTLQDKLIDSYRSPNTSTSLLCQKPKGSYMCNNKITAQMLFRHSLCLTPNTIG